MSKRKKVIFFGLGSIGRRHLNLLKKKYDYDVFAYRVIKKNSIEGVKNLYNINDVFKIDADIAFITNPPYLHIDTSLLCLEAGIKYLFIEKPLSNTLKSIEYFFKEFKNYQALIYIGYNMRFNPVLKRLKEILETKKDNIYYSQTFCGSYLPDWRPRQDYRKTYSAKEKEGGGVILDLSHEFDYNEWLFGKIDSINGFYGKISDLEINSEDFCDVIIKFKSKMIASIHLDYFSYNMQRFIRVLTYNEEIIADLIKKELIIKTNNKIKKESFNFERDYTYEQQLNYFLENVKNHSNNISNLEETKDLTIKLLKFKMTNRNII